MIATVSSMLMDGSPFDCKLLVYCLDNSRTTSQTIDQLDCYFAWSLVELSLGKFLDIDPWGRPYQPHEQGRQGAICGKYRGVVCMHKGDEKYIQKVYRTTSSWNSKLVCFRCQAESQGPNSYTLYGPHAGHRSTMVDTSTFIEQSCHMNPWIRMPGWSVELLANDWLHVVDLTVAPECCACVSWPGHVLNLVCVFVFFFGVHFGLGRSFRLLWRSLDLI